MFEPTRENIQSWSSCLSSDSEDSLGEDKTEEEESTRIGNTNWCECGECRCMEHNMDCVCCVEMKNQLVLAHTHTHTYTHTHIHTHTHFIRFIFLFF